MTNFKELGKVQIGRSSRYPSKKTINLMYREHDTQDRVFTLVLFALFMIFLYFFSRYGVAAQLARADAAEAKSAVTLTSYIFIYSSISGILRFNSAIN